MTILPHRYQLQQLQTDTELDAYLDICMDICESEIGISLLSDTETLAFQLNSILGIQTPTGKCPDQLAWESINSEYTLVEYGEALDAMAKWLQRNTRNVLTVPLHHREKTLGVIHFINIKRPETIPTIQKQVKLMAKNTVNSFHLFESNRWASRLQQLLEFIGSISSSLDQDQILRMMLEQVSLLLDAEAASLFLTDELSGDAILHISSRTDHRVVENYRVPRGKGIINHVLATGETVVVNDVNHDKRHYNGVDAISNFETRSMLAVSLRSHRIELGLQRGASGSRIIGGLEILNKMGGRFTKMDISLAEIFASQAATILQTARLYNEMNGRLDQLLDSLMSAVDAKDPYTNQHSRYVSEYAVAIGRELRLPVETINDLKYSGMLHDVGKIGVPDSILQKENGLTREEYQVIHKHPSFGHKILTDVHFMGSDVLNGIVEHHERLDGSGYPLGLRGNEISLIGRIVAVADVYHALITDRPYRLAFTPDEAFAELYAGADTLFDRRCIDALHNAYKKNLLRPVNNKDPLRRQF